MKYFRNNTQRLHENFLHGVLAVGLFVLMPSLTFAAPGDLDPTFGNGGIVNTRASGPARLYFASAMAIQSDGKIVAAGEGFDHNGDGWDFAVVRYNADGSLDTSFGGTGIVITQVGQSNDGALSVAIQPDGKIVTAGYSCPGVGTFCGSGPWSFAVVRYNPNGSLDTSFNGTGKVGTLVGSSGGFGYSLALQADGKVIVAGYSGDYPNYDFAIVRYNSDGSLDTSFGGTGIVITKVGPSHSIATSVAIQADGKIVAVGRSNIDDTHSSFAAVRYQTNGSLDTTFNGTGIVITPFGSGFSGATDLAIQWDGKILAAGYSDNYPNSDFAFVRYDTNGTPDTSFGDAGKVKVPVGDLSDSAYSVAIQQDGKIVAAGKSFTGTDGEFATVRLNPNGSLDTTFNSTGKVITPTIGNSASAVTLQEDGKIVVAGGYDEEIFGFVLVRYQGRPALRANGKIAFTSDRDGNPEIYVMNPDGTGQVRLTNSPGIDTHPVWSPDGRKLAFLGQTGPGNFAIFVMNGDGSERTMLTAVSYAPASCLWCDAWAMNWSPDGGQIVFQNGTFLQTPRPSMYVINTDGSDRRLLSSTGHQPDWSPDGSTIIFADYAPNASRLFAIRPDGTDRRSLPVHQEPFCCEYSPTWSPAGEWIAYTTTDLANPEIFIARSDGTNPRSFVFLCLTDVVGCGSVDAPDWSPDGTKIVFHTNYAVFVQDVSGQGLVQLTNGQSHDAFPSWQPITKAAADFDGDGRSDVSVFRPSDRVWHLNRSTSGFFAMQFGLSTDRITPADLDGDGKTDIAVYRPETGTWYWLNSSNGAVNSVRFGASEDLPTPADYDGDGRADISVFRPSNGVWYRLNSSDGSFYAAQFGASEDKPTMGDFDGDGRADTAVFRPSNGAWYRLNSSNGAFVAVTFGLATDIVMPADFDGDGKTDVTVYRRSNGTWHSLDSSNGLLRTTQFGTSEDVPTAADFDGDGRADISVFRPSDGNWYRLNSSDGGFFAVHFGTNGDRPTQAAFSY